MMRWNSTKTYTEDDILRMQQDAVTRVHEFQSRAKALPFYDVPDSAITPYQEPIIEAPYEAPMEMEAPSEPEALLEPVEDEAPMNLPQPEPIPQAVPMNQAGPMNQMNVNMNMPGAAPQPSTDPITGILSKLNLDGETLLILGLLFLLYNEKADKTLLMALGYLLL